MFHRSLFSNRLFTLAFSILALVLPVAVAQETPVMTDQAITDKVEDELRFDDGVDPSRIGVETRSGIVTLTGSVDNILARERAGRIAETVRGVAAVTNEVVVNPVEVRTDAAIEEDIRLAILSNPATEYYEIDVEVDEGVAHLEGTLDSFQEHELLRQVVKGVRGVRGVDDGGVEVDYARTRTDFEIRNEITEALRWDLYVDDNLIDVEVNQGAVTLRGTVGSAAEKSRARSTAWVAGVQNVDADDLLVRMWARDEELRGAKYAEPADSAIERAVSRALLYDARILSDDVDVEVRNRTVTLRGTVESLSASWSAERTAGNVVGVTDVDNRLRILPDRPTATNQIEEEVITALRRDPFVERFGLTVDVIDQTVHLYGAVDSNFEKTHAGDVASNVRGVVDVRNHLDIRSPAPYVRDPYVDLSFPHVDELQLYETQTSFEADLEIQQEIEDELWWSPFVDSGDIRVEVDDGIATLNGTVDSPAERDAATENAYEGGAVLVDNEIRVESD